MITIDYLRQFRIGQFAIFDTVISYAAVIILSPLLRWLASQFHLKMPLAAWLWWTLPISVVFHVIFRQSTPVVQVLSDPMSLQFYLAVLILGGMTYMGYKKIR